VNHDRRPAPDTRTRIVVADDHTLFRQGLVEIISTDREFVVVGEAGSGPEAIELVGRLRPDIVILDIEMPGPGARAVVSEIDRRFPDTRIAILTMHDDAALLAELLERGAAAYLLKSIARIELLAALHSIRRPGGNVTLSVSRETIDQLGRGRPDQALLSEREHEVLRLAAAAMTNAQIGARLYIAEATVKRHLTHVYAKLGAVSRMDAIRRATFAGLLDGLEAPGHGPAEES
jgi:DNA-binding NarL/FixJ family response regulator